MSWTGVVAAIAPSPSKVGQVAAVSRSDLLWSLWRLSGCRGALVRRSPDTKLKRGAPLSDDVFDVALEASGGLTCGVASGPRTVGRLTPHTLIELISGPWNAGSPRASHVNSLLQGLIQGFGWGVVLPTTGGN
jgi:hypothetical protein